MTGYQDRDAEVVDYALWTLDGAGLTLRGPKPPVLEPGRYVACVGAAQTFGCLCRRPYPELLAELLGMPVLNLGVGGAGPRFFADRPRVLDRINSAALAVIQVMSGRSEDNALFLSGGGEVLTRRADGARVGAEPAYAELLRSCPVEEIRRIVDETRANWIESNRRLFAAIRVPILLFWFSRRTPEYRASYTGVHALFGGFPQLVDHSMVEAIRPFARAYVEQVTRRGEPHLLVSRFTGEPVTVTGRADLNARVMAVNTYYPTPEMHEDAAQALWPTAVGMLP